MNIKIRKKFDAHALHIYLATQKKPANSTYIFGTHAGAGGAKASQYRHKKEPIIKFIISSWTVGLNYSPPRLVSAANLGLCPVAGLIFQTRTTVRNEEQLF